MKRAAPYLSCLVAGFMLGLSGALIYRLDSMAQKEELRGDLLQCRLENRGLHVCCMAEDSDKY